MATYYVSSIGNDSYTTTQAQNPSTPWKTVTGVNNHMSSFSAGDSILFARGETFSNVRLNITKSGTLNNPITFGAYGTGNKPTFNYTSGARQIGVLILGQQYINIENLNFTDLNYPSVSGQTTI